VGRLKGCDSNIEVNRSSFKSCYIWNKNIPQN